ncbi:MAG TPA: hypothetical protein VJP60_03020 [Rhizomicrobium sp.]|nr:hypothetical protein [Rhizomicrobium sp.]
MLEEIIAHLTNGPGFPLGDARNAPREPGLYSIEEGEKLIYVGLGGNLRKRLGRHRNLNPRSSMFAYRYMLDSVGQLEEQCPTSRKNLLRQEFKMQNSSLRSTLAPHVAKLKVRVAPLQKGLLRPMERDVICKLKPKFNRCET